MSDALPDGAPRTGLRRELGLVGLAAAGIGSMVGAGINIVPFALQRSVPGIGDYVLPAYFMAAVPAVLAALCYAMLGSAMPRAGGSYVYASRSIGPYTGFLASFSQWFGLCIAIGVVSYVIPPFLRDTAKAAQWTELAVVLEQRTIRLILALGFLWTFVVVNLRGVKAVTRTLVPLVVLVFLCSGLVIVTGFTHGPEEYRTLVEARGEGAMLLGTPGAFWTVVPPAAAVLFSSFIGFDVIAQAGGEARNPSRTLPMAIFLAIGVVGVFYFAFTGAVYRAVPWQYIASASAQGDVTAPGLLTPLVSPAVGVLMMSGAALALIKDLPGMLLGVSRLCFAWAEDGVFPRAMSVVDPATGTPRVALFSSAILSTLGILGGHFAGDFFLGVEILVTAMLVNFVIMALSVLRLPSYNPALAREVQVLRSRPLQIVVAVLALITLTALLVVQCYRDLTATVPGWYAHSTLVWLVVMTLGTLVYWRETRALARRGGDLTAITRVLPPE
ncbi:APC family permease [Gemmatimonas phototrophica]|uniref:Amino acid transporter n=1 Tax=Gemmatimonas phototrophica TaxID=1379270 RepID=A0A143BN80_9BACT|nr:APC family permease [Gemmatimonas phototrophica]AMW06083.1 amino acid transporter [Gemmatimonas phototrophica]